MIIKELLSGIKKNVKLRITESTSERKTLTLITTGTNIAGTLASLQLRV